MLKKSAYPHIHEWQFDPRTIQDVFETLLVLAYNCLCGAFQQVQDLRINGRSLSKLSRTAG